MRRSVVDKRCRVRHFIGLIALTYLPLLIPFGCMTIIRGTGYLRFVGNVWSSGVADDPDFLRYWDQVTPENAGKWGNVERTRDRMEWGELDRAYAFALGHGLPFRLHTLVWGQSQPPWLGRLTPEELRSEVGQWIGLLGERYPEVDMIDVVNEPLHAPPPYMDALGGPGETRFDWIITTFELARASFPDASLGINEYGILASEAATSGYLRLIRELKRRGLIDYIGVQGHGLENVDTSTIEANLDALSAERIPVYITELDLGYEDDAQQADRMEELITLFARHRWVRGVTLWGYRQGLIYRKTAWLLGDDGTERPALRWLSGFTKPLR